MKVRYRTYPVVRVCAEHSKEALPMECQVGHVVYGLGRRALLMSVTCCSEINVFCL